MEFQRVSAWQLLPYRLLHRYPLPSRLYWLAARLVNARFLLGVTGVIRDDGGRVLLFQHTYKQQAWGLPGGWMVRGESPLQALEREVREESALVVDARRLLLIGTAADRPMMEFIVGATLVGGRFRPSAEVSNAGWWAEGEVPRPGRVSAILGRVAQLGPGEVGHYKLYWGQDAIPVDDR